MDRTFPAEPVSLREIRDVVRNEAARLGLNRDATEELTLAVSEAATNSIRHTETSTVRVQVRVEGTCLVIEIEDEGTFRRPLPVPEMQAPGPGGRGLLLMKAFVDELSIEEGTERDPGTIVRLVKCRAAAG